MRVPLALPDIGPEEIEAVVSVLKGHTLSMGPQVQEFENRVAAFIGTKHAVAVNSGTSGLHLLVRALGIGDDDEVITPSWSFVASSNVLLYERAVPVFVDIDPETYCLDLDQVRAAIGPKTKAILSVDAFGHPAPLQELRELAGEFGLRIIEDSCEALGAEYDGIKAGSGRFADGAVFAFYPNKQITTGEGGMIVTDREEIASLCWSLRNQGRSEDELWLTHERLGYNYRLDELSAALGCVQMGRLEEFLGLREGVAQAYATRLSRINGLGIPKVSPRVRMSWFVYVIRLNPEIDRDAVIRYLIDRGIGCRPYFTPIHLQPYYRERFGYRGGELPQTEAAGRSTIAIPFHNRLSAEEIEYVAGNLEAAMAGCGD